MPYNLLLLPLLGGFLFIHLTISFVSVHNGWMDIVCFFNPLLPAFVFQPWPG
jgi:hypothetical protein